MLNNHYFPIFINMQDKRFFFWGAGKIASRRINNLLRFGATVYVIAPSIHPDIASAMSVYPKQLVITKKEFSVSDIEDNRIDYAVAATDNCEINRKIVKICKDKSIPVNNISEREPCDFFFPALIEEEDVIGGMISLSANHTKLSKKAADIRSFLKNKDTQSLN